MVSASYYSLVIYPPAEVQGYVNKCKRELHRALGNTWFQGLNAAAHISFVTFTAAAVEPHLDAIAAFCRQTAGLAIALDDFDASASNGTFYLRPDRHSRAALAPLMQAFQEQTVIAGSVYATNPYISIGKKLTEAQLQAAKALFAGKKAGLRFDCSSLWLRKFNADKERYERWLEFPLSGSRTYAVTVPQGRQGMLF